MNNNQRIALSKEQILGDVVDGLIPTTVRRFSTLHDYVDANEYGGLNDDFDGTEDDANAIQDAVDAWLQAGALKDAMTWERWDDEADRLGLDVDNHTSAAIADSGRWAHFEVGLATGLDSTTNEEKQHSLTHWKAALAWAAGDGPRPAGLPEYLQA